MNWQRTPGNPYAIRTDCGRWQISKTGRGDRTTYSLWDNHAPLHRGCFGQHYREAVGHFKADHHGGAEAALKAAKEHAEMEHVKRSGRAQIEAMRELAK